MIHEIFDDKQPSWDSFVLQSPSSHLYHLYSWRHILERSFGLHTFYLISEHQGKIQGILPLAYQKSFLFGSYVLSLPFVNYAGICSSAPSSQDELIQAAIQKTRDLKADCLLLRHASKDIASLPAQEHKVTFVMNLPSTVEQLWKSMKDKVRNQVRKAEKEGLIFKEGGAEKLDAFYALFALNMRNLGSPVISKHFFGNVLSTFPDKARIFLVYLKNQPIATGLTLTHRNTAQIPWAASNWKYLKLNPNVFLYWNILRRCCEDKIPQFDFGRCTRGSGTYHFKQQWGGTEVPLFWFYHVPELKTRGAAQLQPSRTQQFISKCWTWLPIPLANLLGPTISKYLPV